MPATAVHKSETLAQAAKCFLINGEDRFADFLDTLINPPEAAGLTQDLALDVWIYTISPDPAETLAARQQAVADAFFGSASPNELAIGWASLVRG